MAVPKQRDVGDRITPADEKLAAAKVTLEGSQGVGAGLALGLELRFGHMQPSHPPEPGHGDVGLDLVLLVEQPLQRLGALEPVCGQVLGSLCEVEQDRA